MVIPDSNVNEIKNKEVIANENSAKQRIKLIFEPQSVILIGSSKIVEEVGMTSPELFNNIAKNMKNSVRRLITAVIGHRHRYKYQTKSNIGTNDRANGENIVVITKATVTYILTKTTVARLFRLIISPVSAPAPVPVPFPKSNLE